MFHNYCATNIARITKKEKDAYMTNHIKILVLNGPNMNLLGIREPNLYGCETLQSIEDALMQYGKEKNIDIECFQSNHEGVLIDKLHSAIGEFSGIVYNPAAHTHYSYAIRDAIAAIKIPVIEVHMTNIFEREDFRHISVTAEVCAAQIAGRGSKGYFEAVDELIKILSIKE